MSSVFDRTERSASALNFNPLRRDEQEINLIAFIDVLLVVLIFLMLSTTYNKATQLKITLPVAEAEKQHTFPKEVHVGVGADGEYSVGNERLGDRSLKSLTAAMRASAKGVGTPVLVVSADASASHQSVMTAIEAARIVGIAQVTFALQSPPTPNKP